MCLEKLSKNTSQITLKNNIFGNLKVPSRLIPRINDGGLRLPAQSCQGYGREAVTTLVNWSNKHLNLDYFIYPVDRRNIASRKIPESFDGKISHEYQVKISSAKILDLVVYKIGIDK
jgi:hypothetical protein